MLNNKIIIKLLIVGIVFLVNTVYAEEQQHDATIVGVDTPSIYDIDIKWDNMQFTFVCQEKYIYDSTNHIYNKKIEKYWTSSSNNINIKNKSLKEVKINLDFKTINNNVKGSFNKNNFIIKYLDEQNVKFNLNGEIDNSYNEFKNIGEISIIVS